MRQLLLRLICPHRPSKPLNNEHLNVIHKGWFDTQSNGTHCWIGHTSSTPPKGDFFFPSNLTVGPIQLSVKTFSMDIDKVRQDHIYAFCCLLCRGLCRAHLKMGPPELRRSKWALLWIKLQPHWIILTPLTSLVGPKFILFFFLLFIMIFEVFFPCI